MDRGVVLRWFQVLRQRQHLMFLSCCIHFNACSFMFSSFACKFLSCCIHVLQFFFRSPVISIHFPISLLFLFVFLSCSFQCAFTSFHLLSFACLSFRFAFMSFHFLSKVTEMNGSMAWPGQCSKCLSLRPSLNNAWII